MIANKTIILDLDDTIFRTKSMDAKIFEPFFNHLISALNDEFDSNTIERIVSELWERPFDNVIKQYGISQTTIISSIGMLENLDLTLEISTYEDYDFIKRMPNRKFLVTTGFTALQTAKIRALKIENDFTKIIINDSLKESKSKLDIFRELMIEYDLDPKTTFVVGDNEVLEIKAGNFLEMVTVQILRENVLKGNTAKHYIKSFYELSKIMG